MARKRRRNALTPGQRRLARERFQLASFDPSPPPEAKDMETLMQGTIKKLGLGRQQWHHTLQQRWPELMGSTVCRHARPGPFEYGKLTVYVAHPAWLVELKRDEKTLLRKLQDAFPDKTIRGLHWQIDPDLHGGR